MIVKVCGVTREDQAVAIADLGVDLLGLNFVASSPRRVTVERARSIARAVRGRIEVVGVVANLDEAAARELLEAAELDRLQLHGDEPPELVTALEGLAFKAIRVGDASDVARAEAYAGLLLLDARAPGALGGTGKEVDLSLVEPLVRRRDVLLAGGLTPFNVGDRVRAARPWGVDVASGVERAPGDKDLAAVRAFVEAAREAARG